MTGFHRAAISAEAPRLRCEPPGRREAFSLHRAAKQVVYQRASSRSGYVKSDITASGDSSLNLPRTISKENAEMASRNSTVRTHKVEDFSCVGAVQIVG